MFVFLFSAEVARRYSLRNGLVKNLAKFTGKHLRWSLFFLIMSQAKVYNFIKKETSTQVFSCEFYEILRTPFLQNTSGRLLLSVNYFSFYFKENLGTTWSFVTLCVKSKGILTMFDYNCQI